MYVHEGVVERGLFSVASNSSRFAPFRPPPRPDFKIDQRFVLPLGYAIILYSVF